MVGVAWYFSRLGRGCRSAEMLKFCGTRRGKALVVGGHQISPSGIVGLEVFRALPGDD
jgi:hypothetical protein